MPTNWRSARRTAAALLTSAMLTACQQSASPPPVRPNLPDAPALFGKPVPIPEPRRGQDARVFAAATRKAALEANQRLRDDAEFYRDVQTSFGNAVQDETKNDR